MRGGDELALVPGRGACYNKEAARGSKPAAKTQGGKSMKKWLEEFKKFAIKGNVMDMAVGVIIGSAFGKIVSSLVNDLFMPILTLITGGVNTSSLFLALGPGEFKTIDEAAAAGVSTLNYGLFIQNVIDFLLIALCVFLLMKALSIFHKKQPAPPAPRICPFCRQVVDDKATRCPHCTSELPEEEKKA